MRRREFIALLGSSVAGWPLAARAQQGERMRRIGALMPSAADDPQYQVRVGAFLQELQRLGWIIGRNISIETRWTKGDAEEARKYAAELVALNPDLILASGISILVPLLQLTRTVAIVFPAVFDPVAAGVVESLARPGGNATGFMTAEYSIGGKWLELLKEIAPSMTRVAVLRSPAGRSSASQFAAIQAVAPSLRMEINPLNMQDGGEIERAVTASDLPVQAPTKYELILNLKTARALGLEVPPTLMARADEVIE